MPNQEASHWTCFARWKVKLSNSAGRSAVAVHQSYREGGAGTSPAVPLCDDVDRRDLRIAGARADGRTAHLYLWVPNALLPDGLKVMEAWGFQYKANIVWHKVRKDGGSDGRGVGFYFRNVTELLLFGVRGKNARTEARGAARSTCRRASASTRASPMSSTS